ncbi:hypothetical protein FHT44_005058 [Mycolicibacterium sp. BK634]|uniref:hypothetical protein n=1 Tax=Mycolicibacterium sp. BK634 TaxID=2587099 RepID=UPI0016157A3B|nr:hypothetical protein [Mycolicibacterium sp. BK634]MBB3752546.1 hypothetical protein [Mycolicibacterium sp. BK634]
MTTLEFRRVETGVYEAKVDHPHVAGYVVENDEHGMGGWSANVQRPQASLMVGDAGADRFSADIRWSEQRYRTVNDAKAACQKHFEAEA